MKSFHGISKKEKLKNQCSLGCLPIGPLKINNKTYEGVTSLSNTRSGGGDGVDAC